MNTPEKLHPTATGAAAAVALLLQYLGEDSQRDGLKDTPERVVRALKEMTAGYAEDPKVILSTMFDLDGGDVHCPVYDGMVVLRDIEFHSLCEHHLMPFTGRAHVAYIPNGDNRNRVVGISKLARVVDCFARRLQTQERMTAQIAEAVETHLNAGGVAVVIEAQHFCMRMRGCGKQMPTMRTMELRGQCSLDSEVRAETLAMLALGRTG